MTEIREPPSAGATAPGTAVARPTSPLREHAVALAAVLGLALLFLVVVYLPTQGGITNVDGVYEAQVARNLLLGRGYTTNELPLYSIYYAHQHGASVAPPWFSTIEFPLPILLKVVLLSATGSSLLAATTLFSAGCFVGAVVAFYRLLFVAFRRIRPAMLGSSLLASNPLLISAALSGKADPLSLLLFVLALGFLFEAALVEGSGIRPTVGLGVILGLSILTMYSDGLFLALGCAVALGWLQLHRNGLGWRGMARSVGALLVPLGLVLLPFVVAFEALYGVALPSGNLLLQLVAFTPSVKYMNPWWKLTYPSQAANLLPYLGAYSGQLLEKSWVWGGATFSAFLGLGSPYAVVPLTPVSIWWLPVIYVAHLGFRGPSRGGLGADARRRSWIVGWIVLSNLTLAIAILSALAGTVEYVEYLIPGVLLLSVLGIEESLARTGRWLAAADRAQTPGSSGTASATRARRSLRRSGTLALRLWRFAGIAVVGVLIVVPSAVFVGMVPAVSSPASIAPDWYTDADPAALSLLKTITAPNQVVVAAEPWNVAWYDDRYSLPLPPYPDDIYSLLGDGLNVSAVYVANLNGLFFQDVDAPYTYDAYVRLATYDYAMTGFEAVHRGETSMGPDLVLERNPSVPIGSLLQTRQISFGTPSDSGDLVWGWGTNSVVAGAPANWAGEPGGLPPLSAPGLAAFGCDGLPYTEGFCLPTISYTDPAGYGQRGWVPAAGSVPEAELTFLVNGTAPSAVTVELLSPVAAQNVALVVDANRVSYDEPGVLAGVDPVPGADTWTNLTFALPPGTVTSGVNVLDFFFEAQAPGSGATGGLTTVFAAFQGASFS
jgi:hypothetical protein